MALYAIGDLHLSLGSDKPMDVFGGAWVGYVDKLREGLSVIGPEDTTILLGDLSWALDLNGAREDFAMIAAIPGRKIIVKGNHDYWWTTAAKMNAFFAQNGLDTISLLHNNSAEWENLALCGTRGWFKDEETGTEHDVKVLRREVGRLETSLKCAGEREKLVFLHYPPLYLHYTCPEILHVLSEYGVHECCYGHIHGYGCRSAFIGESDGVRYRLVSADFLDFVPYKLR